MRIGELAAVVGVTTRAVRHYHHLGLLPEPERLGNGYRDYTLRHAVVLARIRRLAELGLGLAEVRDVLADDVGKDLAEVLAELDEDLARQEEAIRERRARLRTLLESEGGALAEGPVSPELAALFRDTAHLADSPMAAKDREILALIETAAPPEERKRLMRLMSGVVDAPGGSERAMAVYRLLDALEGVGTDDPRVDEAARALAECVPAELLPEDAVLDESNSFLTALCADFAPAQAEAFRRALRIVAEGRA
ncbi:MerR family transcriptional regulator [Streptomyces sp. DSM 41972]|uniref:MerR family transcriptional regulator n=1 Tax=Streptomyces althioticus subsp. attaecolombicae TaxID=3075534 RepID=A0ABU3HZM4_9ACTN|nr:MerR family transcriptional regulator [Streptomyces sp. DSM 41972]SCD28942.1 DNA-binding transcriptional regulator, MerR family [Streptomyces sp. di50b]SCD90721.1 DNA-binding transcriptional regulator, MerR family [Streptomyces sp. di188]